MKFEMTQLYSPKELSTSKTGPQLSPGQRQLLRPGEGSTAKKVETAA